MNRNHDNHHVAPLDLKGRVVGLLLCFYMRQLHYIFKYHILKKQSRRAVTEVPILKLVCFDALMQPTINNTIKHIINMLIL